MNHVIYLKLRQKQLLSKAEQIHKMTTIFTQNDYGMFFLTSFEKELLEKGLMKFQVSRKIDGTIFSSHNLLSGLIQEIFPPKDVAKCLIITVQQASPQWHILTHLENDSSSWLSRKSFPSLINFVEEMAILFFSIEKQGRRRDLETNPTKVLVCHISSDRLL